jgi:hypothetical protein
MPVPPDAKVQDGRLERMHVIISVDVRNGYTD